MIKWIRWAAVVLSTAAAVTLSVLCGAQKRHLNTLKTQVKQQGMVIDSLLARRMKFIDVKLIVTDKSKAVIYGRCNKGNITMPQERRYILVVDSTNIFLK